MSSGFLTSFFRKSFRPLVAALVIALVGSFTFAAADARLGGGSSFGSRGSRTYTAPSGTATAPGVSPFQRSATPSPGFNNGGTFSRPGGFFGGGGFGRGLLGGFLGAGLFGLLFGHGLTGGLGGGFSIIGLLLQLGLLYLAFRFIMGFIRNRQSSFGRGSSMFGGASNSFGGPNSYGSGAPGGHGGATAGVSGSTPQTTPVNIEAADYEAFERRLIESQYAYSNGDVGTLRRLATPEMAGNFEQELADNNRQGVVNKISDVRLLQGDLSEAWRENGSDYASVAMRFSLVDATIEQRSGRLVAGDSSRPQEATEVWTFVRPSGSTANAWALSGIQQT